ncbi:uncharacterized protein LOC129596576 [Paramacrobiotus metropolitanus]|uniref:uncharacterized protein LOC129596576 n=1 Tax=Paramacrobiotus metropolitanus TaxID=2943436 RepID=UPI00244600E3|nr:uncharacterized protein LOC129596576 [Paramacrobiotus metropolitanus]
MSKKCRYANPLLLELEALAEGVAPVAMVPAHELQAANDAITALEGTVAAHVATINAQQTTIGAQQTTIGALEAELEASKKENQEHRCKDSKKRGREQLDSEEDPQYKQARCASILTAYQAAHPPGDSEASTSGTQAGGSGAPPAAASTAGQGSVPVRGEPADAMEKDEMDDLARALQDSQAEADKR